VKNVAVQGCELSLTPDSSPPASVQITTPPSTKAKADGKSIYSGTLLITISGYTGGAITVPGSGATINPAQLSPGSTKMKVENQAVVLEGDSTTVTVTGQAQSGTTVITATQPVQIKIKSAGQTKVQAD
jgi:hypothetical protein